MIDPTDVTKFDRTEAQLQEFLMFCVAVAGKTAKQISFALECFLRYPTYIDTIQVGKTLHNPTMSLTPFEKIKWLDGQGKLVEALQFAKLGQYTKLERVFRYLANNRLNLKSCTVDQLEEIKGIGPKTSRFFILHTRKTEDIACLDTHVLKYLAKLGHDVPKAPPNGKNYKRLEKAFIEHAKELGKPTYELDLEIWNESSTRSGKR